MHRNPRDPHRNRDRDRDRSRNVIGRRSASRGFTLIESMVAVGIAAVLSGIAWPSFESHLLRARRTDGLVSLLQAQLAQERLRANRASYGTLAEIGVRASSPSGHYTLAATGDAAGYQLVATATGRQARDGACRTLRLGGAGANIEYASGPDVATSNPAPANLRCWGR